MIFRKTLFGGLLATLILTSVEIGEGRLNRTSAQLDVTPGRSHIPMIHVRHGRSTATSTNWSGYAVTGASGSVSDVTASWQVPAVTCPKSPNQYASFWVGIDGYSSNTVEQIGTDSDCQNGVPTYYAWYEFYPHWAYTVNPNSLSVHPGDIIAAEVSVDAKSTFTVTLTNLTSKQSFKTSAKMNNADRSSAEVIVEAPWSGGVLPLAFFNVANFGPDYTGVANSSNVTMKVGGSNVVGSIGSFATNVQIDMVDKGGAVKADTSPLSVPDGRSFFIKWVSAGP